MRATSINAQIGRATLFIFGATVIGSACALFAAFGLGRMMDAANRTGEILRNHMEADMMHDALRADVLAALAAKDPTLGISASDVRNDLAEHSQHFREMVAASRAMADDPGVVAALVKLGPDLDSYIGSAEAIITRSATDPVRAQAELPQFLAAFHALEDQMSSASDLIGASSRNASGLGDLVALITQTLAVAGMILSGAMVLVLRRLARKRLVTPLEDITRAMNGLASGDTSIAAPHRDRADEIGRMAEALERFRDNAIERNRLEAEQNRLSAEREERARQIERLEAERAVEQAARAAEERRVSAEQTERAARLERLTQEFASELAMSLDSLSRSSRDLMAEFNRLDAVTHRVSDDSRLAAAATEGASGNVQGIAAAAARLNASIREISVQMRASAEAAGKAAINGASADATVAELSGSARDIGAIVAMISNVAAQTNILSLNATIEAARAGEVGKGFAVVAGEVKTLASQTSRATAEISERIAQIQGISERSVAEVRAVIGLIDEMRAISEAVAEAAHEQSSATNLIAGNVNAAAAQADEAVASVNNLASATAQANEASAAVQASARSVERLADELRLSSERFFDRLRAA